MEALSCLGKCTHSVSELCLTLDEAAMGPGDPQLRQQGENRSHRALIQGNGTPLFCEGENWCLFCHMRQNRQKV